MELDESENTAQFRLFEGVPTFDWFEDFVWKRDPVRVISSVVAKYPHNY